MEVKLLIIDDEEGVRRSVRRILEREGIYRIYLAENGEKGLELFQKYLHDIVISDLRMPGIEGLEVLKKIGCIKPSTVRIVLTGYGTLEAAVNAMDDGIDGFILKPFDINEFRRKIRYLYVKKQLLNLLPKPLYREITENITYIFPRKSRVVTAFIDIKDFSKNFSSIDPSSIAEILCEEFYNPVTRIIFDKGGFVDKYLGDGIMAVFCEPFANGNLVEKAIDASIEVRRIMMEKDKEIKKHMGIGLPVSIGISYGEVVSGIFGSEFKKDFTALGDPVNKAAKLSKLAGPWDILLDMETASTVKNYSFSILLVNEDLFKRKVCLLE